MSIKHEGFGLHLLASNPLEESYFKAWAEQAPHTLGWLLRDSSDDSRYQSDYSERDAKVAATVIQWLGSPVGQSFVREVLETKERQ